MVFDTPPRCLKAQKLFLFTFRYGKVLPQQLTPSQEAGKESYQEVRVPILLLLLINWAWVGESPHTLSCCSGGVVHHHTSQSPKMRGGYVALELSLALSLVAKSSSLLLLPSDLCVLVFFLLLLIYYGPLPFTAAHVVEDTTPSSSLVSYHRPRCGVGADFRGRMTV